MVREQIDAWLAAHPDGATRETLHEPADLRKTSHQKGSQEGG